MNNFMFYSPTRFIFGKGEEMNVGNYISQYGARKVMVLHYGTDFEFETSLINKIFASLDQAGIPYVDFKGIKPNPTIETGDRGVAVVKEEHVDFLLAVGGGSVIDTAKYIGMAALTEENVWDEYFLKKTPVGATLPVGALPTIAGTGSEGSFSCVMTKGVLKRSLNDDKIRPVFALMNPELSYTLPAFQTACGAVDIMAHVHERYFTRGEDNYLTDNLGESIFRTVIKYLPIALREPENYNARAQLLWASVLAHNDSCGVGRVTEGTVHGIQSEIGGMYDSAHGAGVACVTPGWMKYVYKADPRRFARYFNQVWEMEYDTYDVEGMILEGIERQKQFYVSVGIPVHYSELGVKEEDIPTLCSTVRRGPDGMAGNFMKLSTDDLINIYKLFK